MARGAHTMGEETRMIRIEQYDAQATLAADPSVLEPLWLALFDHHVSTGAAGMVTREREGSWDQRRDHYLDTIAESPHGSLWIASGDTGPVGYALSFEDSLGGEGDGVAASDGSRIEVLETLSLLPETRGHGLGAELVATVEEAARMRGIDRVAIDVMGGNDGALRFYTRAGYAPHSKTWMQSVPPAPEAPRAMPGDTAEAEAVFADIGVSFSTTGRSDDTWVTAPDVAMLDAGGTPIPADAEGFVVWLSSLLRGVELLAEFGYWTVWIDAPESDGAALLGDALIARGFSHGMSRILKGL